MRSWIRRSFKNRSFLTILLVTLIPLLFCDVLMMQAQLLRSETDLSKQAEQQISALSETLSSTFQTYDETTRSLCQSTIVRSALRRGGNDSRILYQILFRTTESCRGYARFDLLDAEGQCQYTTGSALPAGSLVPYWGVLRAAQEQQGLVFAASEEENALIAARAVRRVDGSILGYVVVTTESSGFDKLFSGLYSATNDVALLDPYWRTVYYSQPSQADTVIPALRSQLLKTGTLAGAGGDYHFWAVQDGQTGLTLLLQQPKTFTAQVMRTFYMVSALMGTLCLLLCLWCAWLLSRHLSQPIRQLDEAMREVEKGNFNVQLKVDREDELGRLAARFNRMTEEYRLNLERSVQRQKELNATRLRMFQAQLNPHFLYNTLDSMKWLGVTHNVPQVATLATDLATLLRAGISADEMIPLEEELELVERYLDIQLIRFEDRFTYEFDITERFQSCMVPKLVLQPLVENAIIHGVADKDDGYIKVWAEEQQGDLLLSVSDNGCGLPPDILRRLNSKDKRIPGGHLGLLNVDSIIRLNFGENYGISAQSVPGQGSCIRLRLPIWKERESDYAESIDRG